MEWNGELFGYDIHSRRDGGQGEHCPPPPKKKIYINVKNRAKFGQTSGIIRATFFWFFVVACLSKCLVGNFRSLHNSPNADIGIEDRKCCSARFSGLARIRAKHAKLCVPPPPKKKNMNRSRTPMT